jgi:hypothetical protein
MVEWVASKTVGGVSEVTLFTPIRKGPVPGEGRSYEQRLRDVLDSVQQRAAKGVPTPAGKIPTIHYARWLIVRPEQYLFYDKDACDCFDKAAQKADPAHVYTSWLFFTSNFDGDMKSYLRDFSVYLGDDVDRIWGNCAGYPPGGSKEFDAFWAYARQHQLVTHAFYNAYPGLTVPRVRYLAAFKQRFDAFVAATRRPDGSSIDDLPAAFDRFVAETATIAGDFPDEGGIYRIPVRVGAAAG